MAMRRPEQTEVAGIRDSAGPDHASRAAAGIARGAVIIGSLTIISRILGLVRTLVFAQSVGAGCLGTAYTTANQVPNLIYELVLGGALTSAMVPVLARSAQRAAADPAEKARVAQITSALLTWAVVILVPLTFIIVGVAHPIAAALNPVNPNAQCVHSQMVNATTTMLVAFTPQILLYGISVVLFGVLQAYRRFTGPALAPVIANVVLITCYLCYASLDNGLPLARIPALAELVLAAGTTLNIAALVVVPAFPSLAAPTEAPAHLPVPARGRTAGRRPRACRPHLLRGSGCVDRGRHRHRERSRGHGRTRLVQLRLANNQRGLRGAGCVHYHERVLGPVRKERGYLRPDLRRIDPRPFAHVVARHCPDRGGCRAWPRMCWPSSPIR